MEPNLSRENVIGMLWNTARLQLQPDRPFLRLTIQTYTSLGDEGQNLFRTKFSALINSPTEFFADDSGSDIMFLANIQDLTRCTGRIVHITYGQLPILMVSSQTALSPSAVTALSAPGPGVVVPPVAGCPAPRCSPTGLSSARATTEPASYTIDATVASIPAFHHPTTSARGNDSFSTLNPATGRPASLGMLVESRACRQHLALAPHA
ncbi:hypothetical protein GGR57DRAFT_439862 [Xylariaceae sp. FL1272]|nr:hypothetical protein GGR57DRAFT_439862 [Xylariaceae sp. FL1272]